MAAAAAAEASEYEALHQQAYEATKTGTTDKEAPRLRSQLFTHEMGTTTDALRDASLELQGQAPGTPPELVEKRTEQVSGFVTRLAEDERRYMNRRTARSVSISVARDELAVRRLKQMAEETLAGRIVATGFAERVPSVDRDAKRVVNLLLSDLHIGSWLGPATGDPTRFGPEEESRALAKVVADTMDYKPQYRDRSTLNVYLNGDLVEGLLLHDMRDGAPLTEQVVAFWAYMSKALAELARVYPAVNVYCQPGNHGRNKLRHPGRATSSKWDGEETKMMIGLSIMCRGLLNVRWFGCGITHRLAFEAVPLPGGAWLGLSHGDTEVKLGDPDTKSHGNFTELSNINAVRTYGHAFDVFAFGHFHKARVQYNQGFTQIFNGPLVPPNGHARASGYNKEKPGQWLWESVEGYPVGDMRFLQVSSAYNDAKLNELIPPFRMIE